MLKKKKKILPSTVDSKVDSPIYIYICIYIYYREFILEIPKIGISIFPPQF